jgi:hypothetical protein
MHMFKTILHGILVFFCVSTRLQVDTNGALRDPLYWLYFAVLQFQGINYTVLLYMHKCNFTYGHKKSTTFLRPFSRNLLSVIMCRSLVPIFTSIGQSLCEVWAAVHLLCMYGFHCADFHGTRNYSRSIMGSSPLWKSPCCPCPKKARQVGRMARAHWWSFMLWGHCSTGISSSRTSD